MSVVRTVVGEYVVVRAEIPDEVSEIGVEVDSEVDFELLSQKSNLYLRQWLTWNRLMMLWC